MAFRPTDEQLAVIEHRGSSACVNAVAGSGKTSTLVERNARLVLEMDPARILNIQYNKSAQLTMQRKLKARIQAGSVPEARTFHSIGLGMMKRLIDVGALTPAKLEPSAAVYDQCMRAALRAEWKRVHGRDAFPSQEHAEAFKQFVTRAKADVRPAIEVFRSGDYQIECSPFPAAVARLDEIAREKKICFFDDLLSRTYETLFASPELWSLFANRFEEICVDEFQDVNPVQYALLQGLAGTRARCMVVGDADQSIYAFRGADPSFITTHFARDFAPCTLLRMTYTFRYGHRTALVADHIISKNTERDDKLTIAAPRNPDTVIERIAQTPNAPSGLVAHLQDALHTETLRRCAMLVRYYSTSIPYEIELAEAGIPFHVYGREPLLLIPEIAALVAAMSFATDHWVVPKEVRGRFMAAILKSPTIFAPSELLSRAALDMDRALEIGADASDALFTIANRVDDPRLKSRLAKRADVVRLLEAGGLMHLPPAKIIQAYLSFTDFKSALGQGAGTAQQVREIEQNVAAFTQMASRFTSTHDLLDELGPMAGHREDKPPEFDHLPILSMHRAKGMEFSTVYLPGWSAGNFPREGEAIEEERRLAYVAVTRAIDTLVFLHPADDTLEEQIADSSVTPVDGKKVACSRFLYEGELGLAEHAAQYISALEEKPPRRFDGVAPLAVRRRDVLDPYMKALRIEPMRLEISDAAAAARTSTRANADLVVKEGDLLWNGPHAYRVQKRSFDRFYYVVPLNSGEPRLISLDEAGWSTSPPLPV